MNLKALPGVAALASAAAAASASATARRGLRALSSDRMSQWSGNATRKQCAACKHFKFCAQEDVVLIDDTSNISGTAGQLVIPNRSTNDANAKKAKAETSSCMTALVFVWRHGQCLQMQVPAWEVPTQRATTNCC